MGFESNKQCFREITVVQIQMREKETTQDRI